MASFTGTWLSTFGNMTLTQSGAEVTGSYPHGGGRIQATVDGVTLRGTWSEPDRRQQGPFELTLDGQGNAFTGRWRRDGEAGWTGVWNGSRLEPLTVEGGGSPGGPGSFAQGPLLAGPMLGEVGETSARVWVQARDGSPLTLTVFRPEGPAALELRPSNEEWLCAVFRIDGLSPGQSYDYVIESANGSTERYTLRTAPPKSARKLRVVFGSCFCYYDRPQPIFDTMLADRPDVLVMAGDNAYYYQLDWQSQQTMMMAQLRHRNHDGMRRILPGVPTLAIWDDHDFGPNDSDSSFAGKQGSLAVFKRMWANRAYGTADLPGVHSTVRMGPVEMFLLDGRYYRVEGRRILGDAQLNWLLKGLVTSDAPIKLIVSGSQILPEAAVKKEWECWRRDAPEELERLLSFIERNDVRGVVIASGDVHIGYLLSDAGRKMSGGRMGPELWELTSSPLANDIWHETIAGSGIADRYIQHEIVVANYGVVDVDLDRHGSEIQLSLKDPTGNCLLDQSVSLAALRVRSAPGAQVAQVAQVAHGRPASHAGKLCALAWPDGKAYFFKGSQYARLDLATSQPDPGYPRPIESTWRGLYAGDIDAAVAWGNGKAYFFKGDTYIAFDIARDHAEASCPRSIAAYWPGLWPDGVDAAVVWNNGKAFFFRGSQYVRYDIEADRVDEGYPRSIASSWPGLWPEGIDSVFLGGDGKAYFFKGSEYISYDLATDRADAGYPRPIDEKWGGVFGGELVA